MLRSSEGAGDDDLWAKAAELERDFAGYKRRLAERRACVVAVADRAGGVDEEAEGRGGDVSGRGRRYEEYVRMRDERLRQEWRTRMERKEAEVKALWARLDRAGSRGRRGGDGELAATGNDREGHVKLQQKAGSLEVKVKATARSAPVTPRGSPATKLTRPRTSVPALPAAASPRLPTRDARRRASHSHREHPLAEPPATPRKENRLPPPSTSVAAAPATPRPRTMLSRSRSMLKDSSFSTVRDSPRPPRFQPPRTSCDSASNVKEPALLPDHDAIAAMQSRPCFSEHDALGDLKKAYAVAPEQFHLARAGDGAEPALLPLVTPKEEPDCNVIVSAGCNVGDNCSNGDVDQSSDKSGSPDITGDSDTEPSYVYIKKESGEQNSWSSQASAGPGACPQAEQRFEDKDSCNVEGTMASPDANAIAGGSPMADAEEASRRASSESLYSNVRSSFSQRSELDTSATDSPLHSAPSCSIPPTDPSAVDDAARPRKNSEEEDAEKNLPIPSAPRSSVTVSIIVQSQMDAMTGLKRFLTFGKKNGKGGEAAAVTERASHSLAPAPPTGGDGSFSGGWATGDSVKARTGSSDSDAVASDDLDNSYVISPHVRSLHNFVQPSPAYLELKQASLQAKSPRGSAVHRSFFSISSFKSRANKC